MNMSQYERKRTDLTLLHC